MINLAETYFKKYPDKIDDYNIAKELYLSGESLTDICKKLPFERHALANLFKSENIAIKHSKYSYNENAFKEINDEENAYWLGYMYADGNINGTRMTCDLTMSDKDKNHVDKFVKFIGGNCRVEYNESYLSNYEKAYHSYRIHIYNRQITENLINNGCMWDKTFRIQFPGFINDNLVRHFIRGYFDGDGHACHGARQNCFGFTCGQYEFINDLKQYLVRKLGLNNNKICKDSRGNRAYMIQWSSLKDIQSMFNYLYKDANIYMERKYNVFIEIIGRPNSNPMKSQDD